MNNLLITKLRARIIFFMKKNIQISEGQIYRLFISVLLSITTVFIIHHYGSFSGLPLVDPYRTLSITEPIRSTADDLIGSVFYSCPLDVHHDINIEGKGITWGDVLDFRDKPISSFRETTYLKLAFDGHWALISLMVLVYFLVFTFFNNYKVSIKK